MPEKAKITPIDAAIVLSLILDIIDRFRGIGVEITPGQLVDYIAERERVRKANNERLGISDGNYEVPRD